MALLWEALRGLPAVTVSCVGRKGKAAMLLLEKLLHTDHLSEGQRAVARWLVQHRNEVSNVTTKRIAQETFTSPATVVRLSKNLGYTSFEPLRHDLVAETSYLNRNYKAVDANRPLAGHEEALTVAAKISALARETAADTLALMDAETLENAVDLIDGADTIHMCATSFPLLYAQDFQLKMRRVGRRVEIVSLVGEPLFEEPLVRPGDCAVAISYSGTTPATLDAARMYKRCGASLLAITSMGTSDLRQLADVTLTLTTRERLYSKVAGFTSELSIKLVLDTLYACCFSRHLEEYTARKDEVSSHAEPGRISDSAVLSERGPHQGEGSA